MRLIIKLTHFKPFIKVWTYAQQTVERKLGSTKKYNNGDPTREAVDSK